MHCDKPKTMSALTMAMPSDSSADPKASESTLKPLGPKVRLFVGITGFLGIVVLALAIGGWESADLVKYCGFLLMAVCCSGMRISVPGMPGTLSLNFIFVLFGLVDLSASETVVLGAIVTVVQCLWNRERKARNAQIIFNTSVITVAIS